MRRHVCASNAQLIIILQTRPRRLREACPTRAYLHIEVGATWLPWRSALRIHNFLLPLNTTYLICRAMGRVLAWLPGLRGPGVQRMVTILWSLCAAVCATRSSIAACR